MYITVLIGLRVVLVILINLILMCVGPTSLNEPGSACHVSVRMTGNGK